MSRQRVVASVPTGQRPTTAGARARRKRDILAVFDVGVAIGKLQAEREGKSVQYWTGWADGLADKLAEEAAES